MIEFRCIVADPPWTFGDKLPGPGRGAVKNYSVMTVEEVCEMEVGGAHTSIAELKMCGETYRVADDALLFLWRVSSQVEEAYKVVRAWDFVPKSEIVWIKASRMMDAKIMDGCPEEGNRVEVPKVHFGMGRYVRASHETCIIAARGKAIPLIKSHAIRSIFTATTGAHSQKPEAFYKLIEELCVGPRLELFARVQREGWTCVGDEISPQVGDNLLKEAR